MSGRQETRRRRDRFGCCRPLISMVAVSLPARYLLPGDFKKVIYRPQGWISPAVLVDGRMDGVWKHEEKGRRGKVRIEACGNLPRGARHAAEHEAEQLGTFLGGAWEFSWR